METPVDRQTLPAETRNAEMINFPSPEFTKLVEPLKVALVHDWLTGYRGGEKVLESLCRLFPEAPLYTLVSVKNSTSSTIENREIHTSFVQKMPFGVSKYRHFLPVFPIATETMGVKGYDLIISTSSAVGKSVRTYGAKHWCYVHTPMRYIWDRFDDYFGRERVGLLSSTLLFKPLAKMLQMYDVRTSRRVNHFVANSSFVSDRVKKFYNRDSEIIPPPVDIDRFIFSKRSPQDYYLFFSALVPYKKADHAIKACQILRKRLVVIGSGQELSNLRRMADPALVKFIPQASDAEVRKAYAEAQALLYPGIEDFGIVPVEAIASGCPVIAFGAGGILDSQTIQTSLFYSEQTPEALAQAISEFENRQKVSPFREEDLKKQAQKFSKTIFEQNIQSSITNFIRSAF